MNLAPLPPLTSILFRKEAHEAGLCLISQCLLLSPPFLLVLFPCFLLLLLLGLFLSISLFALAFETALGSHRSAGPSHGSLWCSLMVALLASGRPADIHAASVDNVQCRHSMINVQIAQRGTCSLCFLQNK